MISSAATWRYGAPMWETLANIATTIGIVVALAGAVVGSVLTWRGQKQDREIAEASASRAESAAALTEQYTQRVVDALETLAKKDLGSGPAELRHMGVRWELTHYEGDTYKLENIGDEPAHGVAISADPSLLLRAPASQVVAPGEALTFMAAATMATRDRTITIIWADPSNSGPGEWRYPLPPRPPRR